MCACSRGFLADAALSHKIMDFDANLFLNFVPVISASVLTFITCVTVFCKLRQVHFQNFYLFLIVHSFSQWQHVNIDFSDCAKRAEIAGRQKSTVGSATAMPRFRDGASIGGSVRIAINTMALIRYYVQSPLT